MSSHKKAKRHENHEEHFEEGPWIVSYADMMTLLFCFFVILTSFANFDPVTFAKKSAEVAEHFAPGRTDSEKMGMENLATILGGHPNLKGDINTRVHDGALEIVFSSSVMFEPGSTKLRKDYIRNVDAMIGVIKNKNPAYRVIVEGHTDNSPVSTDSALRSNWEISSIRAASIIERFEFYGFPSTQLVSVGFGDSRPIAPNINEDGTPNPDNQALNRRVVIKVLQPLKMAPEEAKAEMNFDATDLLPPAAIKAQ